MSAMSKEMKLYLMIVALTAVGLALTGKGQIGKRMGQFKGIFMWLSKLNCR
ncbi:hypothetical protein [Desulfobacula sp.]|uniref:hypothetical protein n=1 Tax=Desulfobacula sp. TaxID=2593537 RepID=UPI001EB445DC|nr:hypothetical protein [Desulfobacula sp.]